jgi:hypothetical protein
VCAAAAGAGAGVHQASGGQQLGGGSDAVRVLAKGAQRHLCADMGDKKRKQVICAKHNNKKIERDILLVFFLNTNTSCDTLTKKQNTMASRAKKCIDNAAWIVGTGFSSGSQQGGS